MAKSRTKKTEPEAKQKPDVTVTNEQHVEAVRSFLDDCLQVTFKKTGLPSSRKASTQALKQAATAANADEEAMTLGKRLLASKHEAIKDYRAWQRSVDHWTGRFTFPMASSSAIDGDRLSKGAGTRLVRIKDVEDFETGMLNLEDRAVAVCKRLQRDYDDIIALERKSLGNEFKIGDYPLKDDLVKTIKDENNKDKEVGIVRLSKRTYTQVKAPVQLPPAIQERMTREAAEILNQSVEVAVSDMAQVLSETFLTLARSLVDRVKIMPRHGTAVYQKVGAEAEVIKQITHKEDHNVPAGQRKLLLSWKKDGQKITEEVGPFTDAEFEDLRPETMDSTKKLTTTVVERFDNYLATFTNLKDKLGVYGDHMDKALDRLRELHHSAVGNRNDHTEAVIDNIKNSNFFRTKLREGLEDVSDTLMAVAEESKKVRRRLHGNIASQLKGSI